MIFNPFQKGRQSIAHSNIQIFHTRTVHVEHSAKMGNGYSLSIPVKIEACMLQYNENAAVGIKAPSLETMQFIPAQQFALLKNYCDIFGQALIPTLSQVIQFVEYYRKKKQRVKLAKLKKQDKLEKMLSHNAYGLPLSKGLLSRFAKEISAYVCEAFVGK